MNDYSKKDDFITHGHAKNRLRYHIILSTKYRRKSLSGVEKEVYESFKNVANRSDFSIVDMGIDNGDHVHLVIKSKPSLAPDQIVRRLKQMTSHDLWKKLPDHFRKFYWNRGKKLLWASGYFVSTIGAVSDKKVLHHIKDQAQ